MIKNSAKEIEARVLGRIAPNIDKREGEVTQTTVAPITIELQNAYDYIESALLECFPDTASRPFLLTHAKSLKGIEPFKASKAKIGVKLSGTFISADVLGKRFFTNEIPFTAIEDVTSAEKGYNFIFECEDVGVIGNQNSGNMVPFENIAGLITAIVVEIAAPAVDEESTEDFRTRYLALLKSEPWGGNKADYYYKMAEIIGPYRAKISRPASLPGGNFDIYILGVDDNFSIPETGMVESIQEILDPVESAGSGNGIAGIGQKPHIKPARASGVNIQTTIEFKPQITWDNYSATIISELEKYFLETRKTFYNTENIVVRLSQIENRLGDLPGVLDVRDTTLNNVRSNLILAVDEVPFLGEVTLNE